MKAGAESTSCHPVAMKSRKVPEARLSRATSAHDTEPWAEQGAPQQRCGHGHSLLTHSDRPKWRCFRAISLKSFSCSAQWNRAH